MRKTVYCILRHVSKSGTTRWIGLYVWSPQFQDLVDVTRKAAEDLGWPYSEDYEGVKVKGVGLDAGWYTVHQLELAWNEPLKHRWL